MKKIGIVYAISQAAGEHVRKQIIEKNKAAKIVVHECPAAEYKAASSDLPKIATLIMKSIDELCKQGAEVIIIAANSVHRAFNIVLELTKKQYPKIELLSIIDATVEETNHRNFHQVSIFGSSSTINSRIYQDKLDKVGIKTIPLSDLDQDFLNKLISGGPSPETINASTTSRIKEILNQQATLGSEAVIFACTELSLIVKPDDSKVPIVDTSKVLAAAAVRKSAQGTEEESKQNFIKAKL